MLKFISGVVIANKRDFRVVLDTLKIEGIDSCRQATIIKGDRWFTIDRPSIDSLYDLRDFDTLKLY